MCQFTLESVTRFSDSDVITRYSVVMPLLSCVFSLFGGSVDGDRFKVSMPGKRIKLSSP